MLNAPSEANEKIVRYCPTCGARVRGKAKAFDRPRYCPECEDEVRFQEEYTGEDPFDDCDEEWTVRKWKVEGEPSSPANETLAGFVGCLVIAGILLLVVYRGLAVLGGLLRSVFGGFA